jgi:hypothetical protein
LLLVLIIILINIWIEGGRVTDGKSGEAKKRMLFSNTKDQSFNNKLNKNNKAQKTYSVANQALQG